MAGVNIKYPNDFVFFVVDNYSRYAMVMQRDVKSLTIYDIEGIDKKGYYFSTYEKAAQAVRYSK